MGILKKINKKIFVWRLKYINRKSFIVITSMIIGILAALAAILLKLTVHYVKFFLQYGFNVRYHNYMFLIYPLTGIALTILYIQLFRKGHLTKGLSSLIYSFSKHDTDIPRHKMYSHMITSALTVGFGGSVGLEAPIVITGSAIGANTAKELRLGHKERNLLVACGAASGIAAIFNSPIGGIIFAFEVLLPEMTIPSLIPLLISSASASVVSRLLYSEQLFYLITTGWSLKAIPFYILLGILCGLISAYMIKVSFRMENYFKSQVNIYKKMIFGGALLGILIFFLPPLYGEGYETVKNLFSGNSEFLTNNSIFYSLNTNQWFLVIYAMVIVLVKVFASSITVGAGGNGGIFAPSLFVGSLLGFAFVHAINLTGFFQLNEPNFIAVGMAGILSGVIHAPLTGIFLIAEVTGGYALFVPLMIVSALSYFTTRYFEPHSIYTKVLAEDKKLEITDKDQIILNQINLNKLIETDFALIFETDLLEDFFKKSAASKRNIFPVVDKENNFKGLIYLNDTREKILHLQENKDIPVLDFIHKSPLLVNPDENIQNIMNKFEENDLWNIPVVDNGKYIGFIYRSRILQTYRELLRDHSRFF